MSTEISAKINTLLTTDSRYVNMSRADALSQMVKDGVLTKAQYDAIINGTVFVANTQTQTQVQSTAQLMGAYFTLTNPTSQAQMAETSQPQQAQLAQQSSESQQPQQTQQKRFHPMFKDILLTSDGKVDTEQFSLEAIKAKYNSENYIIQEKTIDDKNMEIIVFDKITDSIVESVSKTIFPSSNIYINQTKYDKKGNLMESLSFLNDEISSYTTYSSPTNSKTYSYNNGDVNDIYSITSRNDKSEVESFYKDGKIIKRTTRDDNFDIIKEEHFLNGKVYAEYGKDGEVINNFLMDGILDCFTRKGKLEKNNNLDEIMSGITDPEVMTFIADAFKQKKNTDIRLFIDSCPNMDNVTKEKYIKQIDNLLSELKSNEGGYYEARRLRMSESNYEFFANVMALDSKNIRNVLLNYGGRYASEQGEIRVKHAPHTLMDEINNRFSNEETRSKLYNHLIDALFEQGDNLRKYNDDIKSDIASHPDDFSKLAIDVQRLVNRNERGYRKTAELDINGKLDKDFKQGSTGDCWLLAGVLAINKKNPEFFEKLMPMNPDGSRTVMLPGVEKSYIITQEEIQGSRHLAEGEGDIRALEIAVDKYLKEKAYLDSTGILGYGKYSDDTDIIGGYSRELFEMFVGNGQPLEFSDLDKVDFNDKKKVFSFAISDEKDVSFCALDDENNEVELYTYHAYALVGSDDKYLYLINPHDSSKTIKLLKSYAEKMKSRIDVAELLSKEEIDARRAERRNKIDSMPFY